MSGRPLAIAVDGVSKDFRLPSERRHTLKERVVNPRFDREAHIFHALSDVSFEVYQGEFFGIVGRNGSGKSTLLKCMAGIYKVDHGRVRIAGRLSTFIELGVGFNPDLAARDNIILNGIMLGLTPREAAARVDEVIAFAELEEHADVKLKNYSSGMQVRLAFSVMTQIEADVLLIDEVLAVGDASFQAKCFDVFRQLRERGKTIVLVTHDMSTVVDQCDRAMLVEDGVITAIGDPETVGNAYLEYNFGRTTAPARLPESSSGSDESEPDVEDRIGSHSAYLVNVEALDDDLHPTRHIATGGEVTLTADVVIVDPLIAPRVRLWLRDDRGNDVLEVHNGLLPADERPAPGTVWQFSARVALPFRSGRLRLFARVTDGDAQEIVDQIDEAVWLTVSSVRQQSAIVDLPFDGRWTQRFASHDEVREVLAARRAAGSATP
ncbi:MAG: ABC transporter ATP-binding protein [Solirubrobacteraceae bacterium]|nr:ABC transporter ATP-binding protein [Solirubrobacteraceae bacterium]